MKFTISKKMFGGFSLVILLMTILSTISIVKMTSMGDKAMEIEANWMPSVKSIADLNSNLQDVERLTLRFALEQDDKEMDKLMEQINTAINELKEAEAVYTPLISSSAERAIYDEFSKSEKLYLNTLPEIWKVSRNNDFQKANALLQETKSSYGQATNSLQKAIDLNAKGSNEATSSSVQEYKASRLIVIYGSVIAIVLGLFVAYFFGRMISRPLVALSETAGRIAEGDLTMKEINIKNRDEIGDLAGSFNHMLRNLKELISKVLLSSNTLAAAAQQISSSTEEIASGSMSQAKSAGAINELFRELSQAINSVARNANQTADLTNNMMVMAQEGGKVIHSSIVGMEAVNHRMSLLAEDSNKIGEIIEVIDDIADQTNLLALNAAIEAARAGDQGRGFAVVADEVRKLAERSSVATKQITVIINEMQVKTQQSVNAVGENLVLSQKTGDVFENIIAQVNESAQQVSEIAASSEQQSSQTLEVLRAIETISASTEEAAAGSEETAATAESLANLADELNTSVSIFKIN